MAKKISLESVLIYSTCVEENEYTVEAMSNYILWLCMCVGVGQEELLAGEDSADSEPLGQESAGLRETPLLRLLPGCQGNQCLTTEQKKLVLSIVACRH